MQARLEKMEAQYKQQTFTNVDSAMVRVLRMIIDAYSQKTYIPKEVDKITHEEWLLDCEKELRYQRIHFGEQAVEDRKQINGDFEAFVTEVDGWND